MEWLEKMAEFFALRVEDYDRHMLEEVEGCREGYEKMAELVPSKTKRLLDLGCGTGLELERIFKKCPDIFVTGVDLCPEMLQRLKMKFKDKSLELICGDYFKADFGCDFDCAISFQTMHHFSMEKKTELYRKICNSLRDSGFYIECDYMVEVPWEQEHWFSECERLRKEQGIADGEFYHYDTPCTIENQMKMLKAAGFEAVEKIMRIENTTMLIARKG